MKLEDLLAIFPAAFVEQEISTERYVKIPEEVIKAFESYRPSPLIYAAKLRDYLQTPAHILYKYEGISPTGSHKNNSAIVQAYLAAKEGVEALTTETGAGQWGSALAHACSIFGVNLRVFMVRISYLQKPGRRILMELFEAKVFQSPSQETESGRKYYDKNPDHPGSLGIAISEAVELAVKNPSVKYSRGSVLDSVLMHQTIIGQEAEQQLKEFGMEILIL